MEIIELMPPSGSVMTDNVSLISLYLYLHLYKIERVIINVELDEGLT